MRDRIMQKLEGVTDPETGLNVIRMGLVRDLRVEEEKGDVRLVFRPTSFFCPMAFKLAADIQNAIKCVDGVGAIKIEVENFERAKELTQLLENG